MIAEALGKSLTEVRDLPSSEVEEWRAFYSYRQKVQDFEERKRGA